MKNKITLLLLVMLTNVSISTFAQITFQKKYARTYGDRAYSAEQTTDGGYIMVGYTDSIWSIGGSKDVFLIKTDASGDTLWTKRYGGTNTDIGQCVHQTTDGGYIIAGSTHSFVANNQDDFYLIKTDASGNLSWSKTFGSPLGEHGYWVEQTTDGGYIMTGYTVGFGGGFNHKLVLIKTDASGNLQWHNVYSALDDDGYCVKQTPDGGYIAATWANGFSGYDAGLLKTDANGTVQWYKSYGGAGDDRGNFVQVTTDGGYLITGYTNSFGAGGYDLYVIKTNATGNVTWSKSIGEAGDDYGFCGKQIPGGGFIVTGYVDTTASGYSGACLLNLSPGGDVNWSKYYNPAGETIGFSVQRTTDGGYIVGGTTRYASSNVHCYLLKTNANGDAFCYDSSYVVIEQSPATTESVLSTTDTSGFTSSNPATAVYSGSLTTTICSSIPTAAEQENSDTGISVFPNPATNELRIENGATEIELVEIYDVLGEKVFSYPLSSRRGVEGEVINVSSLPPGIYFVKVKSENADYTAKILKQ